MAPHRELGLGKMITKQTKGVYGTRDAGMIWEETYRKCLEDMGFISGLASPCCFRHPLWNVELVVHGDDFTAMGLEPDLNRYHEGLKACFEIKHRSHGRTSSTQGDENSQSDCNNPRRRTQI